MNGTPESGMGHRHKLDETGYLEPLNSVRYFSSRGKTSVRGDFSFAWRISDLWPEGAGLAGHGWSYSKVVSTTSLSFKILWEASKLPTGHQVCKVWPLQRYRICQKNYINFKMGTWCRILWNLCVNSSLQWSGGRRKIQFNQTKFSSYVSC